MVSSGTVKRSVCVARGTFGTWPVSRGTPWGRSTSRRAPSRHRRRTGNVARGTFRTLTVARGTFATSPLPNATNTEKSGEAEQPMTIRILLADDQALLRTTFRMLIEANDDMAVVGEAADGTEAVALTGVHRPDLVLMDI